MVGEKKAMYLQAAKRICSRFAHPKERHGIKDAINSLMTCHLLLPQYMPNVWLDSDPGKVTVVPWRITRPSQEMAAP